MLKPCASEVNGHQDTWTCHCILLHYANNKKRKVNKLMFLLWTTRNTQQIESCVGALEMDSFVVDFQKNAWNEGNTYGMVWF